MTNIYDKAGKESLQTDLKKRLVAIRKRYDDNSNVAEKPEAWKKTDAPVENIRKGFHGRPCRGHQ